MKPPKVPKPRTYRLALTPAQRDQLTHLRAVQAQHAQHVNTYLQAVVDGSGYPTDLTWTVAPDGSAMIGTATPAPPAP